MLATENICLYFKLKTEKSFRSEYRGKRLKLSERVGDLRGVPRAKANRVANRRI